MTNLKDFMEKLNFEDVKKHLGYEFCIDFDDNDEIKCWFESEGTFPHFGCFKIEWGMTEDDFKKEVEKIEEDIDELKEIQKKLTVSADDIIYKPSLSECERIKYR